MGHSSSTLADQSDTLNLSFLSQQHTCFNENEKPKMGESKESSPTNTNTNGGKASVDPSSPTSPTSPGRTRPRFLGFLHRKSHHAQVLPPMPHMNMHVRRPSLHVPHVHVPGKKSKPATKTVDVRPTALMRRGPKPRTLLRGCSNANQHYDRMDSILESTKGLRGAEGLKAAGFEYKMVRCPDHRRSDVPSRAVEICHACVTRLHYNDPAQDGKSVAITPTNRPLYIADGIMYEEIARLCQEYAQKLMAEEGDLVWITVCDDDDLGESVRCLVPRGHKLHCREASQDEEGKESCDGEEEKKEGTFSDSSDASSPILLITTGKGKVRAGIFSRAHLMTTALEPATALPIVREAKRRGMRCVIPDPNARGDRHGMETFKRSISRVFEDEDDDNTGSSERSTSNMMGAPVCSCQGVPIYVLAHSASGAQFVRYLRDYSPSRSQRGPEVASSDTDDTSDIVLTPALIDRIQAVAFTDSTHNIQWTRKDSAHKELEKMLEGDSSLYVRVESEGSGGGGLAAAPSIRSRTALRTANSRGDEDAGEEEGLCDSIRAVIPRETAGTTADTDQYWKHRFGSVRTVWAGTPDHSLTNWAAHDSIWDHFDKFQGSS